MGFLKQKYWSGLPCSAPGDLPNPGIKPVSLISPALAGGLFIISTTWEALQLTTSIYNWVKAVPLINYISEHSKVAFLIKTRSEINSNTWLNLKRNSITHSLPIAIYLLIFHTPLSYSLPFPHSLSHPYTEHSENLIRHLEIIGLRPFLHICEDLILVASLLKVYFTSISTH